MYEELGSIRGVVDLSPQEALDRAEAFLTQQGYTTVRRAGNSLTMQRHPSGQDTGQGALILSVAALPQPEGGVRLKVRGNDREGVQERQAAWVEWSESLPKKPEAPTEEPGDQQRTVETSEVPLSPPPRVESADLSAPPSPPSQSVPPPPRRESTVWRGTKLAFGGCIVLPVLLLVGFVACVAVFGSGSREDAGSKSEAPKGKEDPASIGEPVTVGDVTWTVTNARQANQLRQQGAPSRYAKTEQGNFVIVDFDFTNNGSDPITLHNDSLALIDSEGRESKADSGYFLYIPEDRRIFLERINPGVTQRGQAIFEVASGASGFTLQAGDATAFTSKNGYIDLGF